MAGDAARDGVRRRLAPPGLGPTLRARDRRDGSGRAPALPADGRGTLDVVVSIAGDTARYGVRDANLTVERATLTGDLGLVLVGDTLAFRDTDLRFADVDTRLIERLATFHGGARGTVIQVCLHAYIRTLSVHIHS